MAIFVRSLDGSDHMVKMQSSDEEKEIDSLLRGAGWPYEQGWIELDGKPPRYAALRHVLSVEIREASEAGGRPSTTKGVGALAAPGTQRTYETRHAQLARQRPIRTERTPSPSVAA